MCSNFVSQFGLVEICNLCMYLNMIGKLLNTECFIPDVYELKDYR